MPVTAPQKLRAAFFDYVFSEEDGHVCIAYAEPNNKKSFTQRFFKWPGERGKLLKFVEDNYLNHNVWFCVNLLKKAERKKENCLPTNLVWADLDTCNPKDVEPSPQCIIKTSPHRWQAIWRLEKLVDPYIAEEYSKKIAYKYSNNGADPSGWDLTQLLRVPFTFNYKYETEGENVPNVELVSANEVLIPASIFESIEVEDLPQNGNAAYEGMPDPLALPNVEQVLYKYWHNLRQGEFPRLYEYEPSEEDDWSKLLWRVINLLLESGMDTEETFAVTLSAKCNKYERDSRPISYLWKEILKADEAQKRITILTGSFQNLVIPELVDDKAPTEGLIADYAKWGVEATDAVEQYHELTGFILLSSILAQRLRLKTSYGTMVPNLWGLILGTSTLTRKTTAMRMAVDLLSDIDPSMVLATDGSVEGLLTGLSQRPSMTSIFYKDEVSGFFDSINRKDYLAGMPETLTHLYDVPQVYQRLLRKETITISNPIFIFFGGGIRDKVYSLLSDQYVLSGFLPRFLVVSGEADLTKIRRTGPATGSLLDTRANLLTQLASLHETYVRKESVSIAGQSVEMDATCEVHLTTEAWNRYGDIEMEMVAKAQESDIEMLALPTFERLSRSLLKMACLWAAARQDPVDNTIQVEESDINIAAYYIQRWGGYSIDLIYNAGRSDTQREFERILEMISRHPGILRSRLMQIGHLTKRTADEILLTLEERGQIRIQKEGKGSRIWAIQ